MAEESEEFSDENGDDDDDYDVASDFSFDNMDSILQKERSNSNFANSGSDFNKQRTFHQRRTTNPEPLPIYQGQISGYEPSSLDQ